jgi:hypothetical protein
MCPRVAPAKKCKRCSGGPGNLPVGLQSVQNAPYPRSGSGNFFEPFLERFRSSESASSHFFAAPASAPVDVFGHTYYRVFGSPG